jgi:hypothetical protein
MSAARNIPFEDNLAAVNITIDSTFTPTPQGAKLGVGQTITFTNNSGQEISLIQFNPNPPQAPSGPGPTLFSNVTDLENNEVSPVLTPSPAEGSVNYLIFDENGDEYGPFSIQLGDAVPLKIQIIASEIYPATAAIPQLGSAAIYSDDQPCVQYPITWGANGNPFTTVASSAACGFSSNAVRTTNANPNTYPYGIVRPIATGGGKIKVQS